MSGSRLGHPVALGLAHTKLGVTGTAAKKAQSAWRSMKTLIDSLVHDNGRCLGRHCLK